MPLPITFDEHGLVPVVVQDHLTGEVRMLAYANEEAVRRTLDTGRATFWSRSRAEIWEKGRTSGNRLEVVRVLLDCDGDALVYASEPHGPTCHTGAASCFFRAVEGEAVEQPQTLLGTLEAVLESRKKSTGEASYTKSLYDAGAAAMGAKVREEAGEFAAAVENESDDRVVSEAADALYHVLVALRWRAIPLRRVLAELARRLAVTGHEEKASRSQ